MADEIHELAVRLSPSGEQETQEALGGVREDFEATADESEDAARNLTKFSRKFTGALTVAGVVGGGILGGIISQAPAAQEALAGVGSVIDSLALKLDQSPVGEALRKTGNELFALSQKILKANTFGEALSITVGFAVEKASALAGEVQSVLREVGPQTIDVALDVAEGSVDVATESAREAPDRTLGDVREFEERQFARGDAIRFGTQGLLRNFFTGIGRDVGEGLVEFLGGEPATDVERARIREQTEDLTIGETFDLLNRDAEAFINDTLLPAFVGGGDGDRDDGDDTSPADVGAAFIDTRAVADELVDVVTPSPDRGVQGADPASQGAVGQGERSRMVSLLERVADTNERTNRQQEKLNRRLAAAVTTATTTRDTTAGNETNTGTSGGNRFLGPIQASLRRGGI